MENTKHLTTAGEDCILASLECLINSKLYYSSAPERFIMLNYVFRRDKRKEPRLSSTAWATTETCEGK